MTCSAVGAVVGGEAVHQLGFQFVITPVTLNVATILVAALLFNAPFAWRRYPAAWSRSTNANRPEPGTDTGAAGVANAVVDPRR